MRNREITMRSVRAFCVFAACAAAGCFGGSAEPKVASSGDPEADRRADMRLGTQDSVSNAKAATDKRTLYDRLGGAPTITALVDDMTTRATADPRVNFQRKNVKSNWVGGKYKEWEATPENIDRFKQHMVEFLTLATGGPAEYSGREVGEAHKGMKITNNEFDSMVGDIKTSMDKLGLATREKRDLLAIIETTRKQIVEKQ